MSSVPYTFAGAIGNIPLSQLDVNFSNVKASSDYVIQSTQANITALGTLTGLSVVGNVNVVGRTSTTGNVVGGNLITAGQISSVGTATVGNLISADIISAVGNVSAGGMVTNVMSASTIIATTGTIAGCVTVSGTVTANAGLRSTSEVSAAGNVIGGNILTSGIISGTGNVSTAANLNVTQNTIISGNLTVAGNALISGTTTFVNQSNLSVANSTITVANGVSTSALIDGAGINAGNPTVAYIRYSNALAAWTTANNFSVGGNLLVTGTAFAETPSNATSNTQLATTLFVNNRITTAVGNLGTISTQNANNVAITGGSISGITDLAVADGGTGASTFTANNILLGNGSSSFQTVAPGSSGYALRSNGSTWTSQRLGLGMTGELWQDVTGARSAGVQYTNTNGYPIQVALTMNLTFQDHGINCYVNGVLIQAPRSGGNFFNANGTASFIVPTGATYQVNLVTGQSAISLWAELS
jgi:hypothetical protein